MDQLSFQPKMSHHTCHYNLTPFHLTKYLFDNPVLLRFQYLFLKFANILVSNTQTD